MIRAYGCGTHLTPGEARIRGCIAGSEKLASETGAFLPRQFAKPANVEAHQLGPQDP